MRRLVAISFTVWNTAIRRIACSLSPQSSLHARWSRTMSALRASAKGTGGSTGSLSLHDSTKLNYRSRFDVNRMRETKL
jgi:hypothetical protein